jgi:hypothetical protein
VRWLLPLALAVLALSACSVNNVASEPGGSRPTYPSIYYFLAGSTVQELGNYDLADQLYRSALDSDPKSAYLRKRVLLNSFNLYNSGLLDEDQMKGLIASYDALIPYDEEILTANYNFYEQVADSTAMALTISRLETRFPSAQTYILRFIHSFRHEADPKLSYLDQALELAWNDPRQLQHLSRFYFFYDLEKSIRCMKRALEINPSREAHEMMSELVVSSKNPAWAKDYAATLSYPEDRENLLYFLNMAFDARQLELILALDDTVLRIGDLDLMYLLGVSALFSRRPDILAGIETQLPKTAGLDENRQYLYAILGANTLLNGNGTALKRYLPQITSTQYYDNIYNFYTFAGAYQVPDSVSTSSRDLAEGFSSRVRDSLPDGAPSQYLTALASASTDSTYTGYAIAKFNLIQYLGAEHGYSEDDLEFLLQFYYDQGQLDQHRALLPDAVRRYPDNPLFLNDLGYTLLLEGEFLDKGASLIRRALVFDPENPFYLDSLAWYYYLIGDYATAATYLDIPKTMENMPSEIAWHIGAIYLALNDKDQARDFFLKCIEIGNDPDYVQRATEAMKLLGE